PTTVGDESSGLCEPVPPVHEPASEETLLAEMRFSVRSHASWVASKPACPQSDLTENEACPAALLALPIALIQCVPGTAPVGMRRTVAGKRPLLVAIATSTSVESTYRSTVSPVWNPLTPVTVIMPVGRTADCERLMLPGWE